MYCEYHTLYSKCIELKHFFWFVATDTHVYIAQEHQIHYRYNCVLHWENQTQKLITCEIVINTLSYIMSNKMLAMTRIWKLTCIVFVFSTCNYINWPHFMGQIQFMYITFIFKCLHDTWNIFILFCYLFITFYGPNT